jgi:uncharacterized protein (DUF2336 family)
MKDLQDALSGGSSDRRSATLQRLAELLLSEGSRLTAEQIGIFDAVLADVAKACDAEALVDLARKLAPVAFAPAATVKQLARHSDINVAGPVLSECTRLSNEDLMEAAASHGQNHLLAIAKRKVIDEALSDVLIELGNRDVRYSIASNEGAKVSPKGFKHLVASADGDALMTEKTGLRPDLPLALLTTLLQHTNSAVRSRLLAKTPAHRRADVQRSVELVEKKVEQQAERTHDFRSATDVVQSLKKDGRLTESKLAEFAKQRQYEATIVALAALASAPIELIRPLMRAHRSEGLVVACRAAELSWETTEAVVLSRLTTSKEELQKLRRRFDELSVSIAKRTLHIWTEQAFKPRRAAS